MNNYFTLPDDDKIVFITQTALKVGLPAVAIEKDIWVTAVLQTLFSLPYSDKLVFKGGTSLSKIWGCITRFSEDADVAIDRTIFGEEFEGDITKRQLKKLRKSASVYVRDVICSDINKQLEAFGLSHCCIATPQEDGEGDGTYPEPRQIHIIYKSLLDRKDTYIKKEVLLEISSRSLIEPTGIKSVSSIVSMQYPQINCNISECKIITALPEKTFLEKAFLLHELFSVNTPSSANRRSRHLYDLEKMMDEPFAINAIKNDEIWESIRHHREIFTPINGFDYSLEIRDNIVLIPPTEIIEKWRDDYDIMAGTMIYGDKLTFDELVVRIEELQNRFRNR